MRIVSFFLALGATLQISGQVQAARREIEGSEALLCVKDEVERVLGRSGFAHLDVDNVTWRMAAPVGWDYRFTAIAEGGKKFYGYVEISVQKKIVDEHGDTLAHTTCELDGSIDNREFRFNRVGETTSWHGLYDVSRDIFLGWDKILILYSKSGVPLLEAYTAPSSYEE